MQHSTDSVAPRDGRRPLLSVMLPVYRPGPFLLDALQSAQAALRLSGTEAQVEVVDDGTPGIDVRSMIDEWAGAGLIKPVSFFRREINGGLGACWNTCVERARGDYVHILHQDDLVRPEIYGRVLEAAQERPDIGMFFCRATLLADDGTECLDRLEEAEDGVIRDWVRRICTSQRVFCPAVFVRRDVYQNLGLFDPRLKYVIDWEMWVRISASCSVYYITAALATYRVHSGAETARLKEIAAIANDASLATRVISEVLTRTGHSECISLARAYALTISRHAVHEAEQKHRWGVAARELLAVLYRFGPQMTLGDVAAHSRWLVRLGKKAAREALALSSRRVQRSRGRA